MTCWGVRARPRRPAPSMTWTWAEGNGSRLSLGLFDGEVHVVVAPDDLAGNVLVDRGRQRRSIIAGVVDRCSSRIARLVPHGLKMAARCSTQDRSGRGCRGAK